MTKNNRFADLLSDAMHKIKKVEGKNIGVIEDEIGYAIGRDGGSPIDYWRRGHPPSRREEFEKLAIELVHRGHFDKAWLIEFLEAGEYPYPKSFCAEAFPEENDGKNKKVGNDDAVGQIGNSVTEPLTPRHPLRAAFSQTIENAKNLKKKNIISLVLIIIFSLRLPAMSTGEKWAIKFNCVDDLAAILVNGEIWSIHIAELKSDWIEIHNFDNGESPDFLIAHLNGSGPGKWDFSLRHNGKIVERESGKTSTPFALGTVQAWSLLPNGKVEAKRLSSSDENIPSDTWEVKIIANYVGFVLVNDIPVAGAYTSQFGKFSFYDISKHIHSNQENYIKVLVWNDTGIYSWNVSLLKNGKQVWETKGEGLGVQGTVFSKIIIINSKGNRVP